MISVRYSAETGWMMPSTTAWIASGRSVSADCTRPTLPAKRRRPIASNAIRARAITAFYVRTGGRERGGPTAGGLQWYAQTDVRTVVGLLFASLLFVPVAGQEDLQPTVILVGFDGWRWDYHTKAPTPNLRSLMARGVRAENLIPTFPSKTFPNFYSIVTGLYAGHHGIVANNIKDPATGRTLTLSKREEVGDAMWWGGEPIWLTSARAGKRTGAMFWP